MRVNCDTERTVIDLYSCGPQLTLTLLGSYEISVTS